MKSQLLLGLLATLLLSSCGPPDIRIKRLVGASEIEGTWTLDPASSALQEDYSGLTYEPPSDQPHTITFAPDGSCQFRSVLQFPTRYLEVSGTWKIVSPDDNPQGCEIELALQVDRGTTIITLDLKEESDELILWEFWGDPDSWRFLEYRRTSSEEK